MWKKRHPKVEPQVEEYRLTWGQRRRLLADYWEKQRRDAQAALDYAREEGFKKGLEESRRALAEQKRDRAIAEKDQALAEKDREIAELQRKLQDR
jgi:hypothetical protein